MTFSQTYIPGSDAVELQFELSIMHLVRTSSRLHLLRVNTAYSYLTTYPSPVVCISLLTLHPCLSAEPCFP